MDILLVLLICCLLGFILTRLIGYYTLLLLVLMGISLFYYHVPASEVVRTIRPYFLVYAYFPLRRLTYEQYNKVVYALWLITLVQSVLFVLQAATKLPFLADQYGGGPGDFIFYRYYNYPKLLYLAAYLPPAAQSGHCPLLLCRLPHVFPGRAGGIPVSHRRGLGDAARRALQAAAGHRDSRFPFAGVGHGGRHAAYAGRAYGN